MRLALGRLAAEGWRIRLPRPRWFRAAVAAGACAVAAFLFGVGVGGAAAAGAAARQVRSVPVSARAIALTFDDGPDPTYTPAILALLERYGAKATFFVIGQELVRYPAIGRAEAAAGMEIGNHGFHHVVLAGLDPTAIRSEAQPVEREITSITGNRPTLYRLPRGRASGRALRALADLGYTTVNWSIDTRDWTGRNGQAIAGQVLAEAEPGAIVLLHDGGGNRQTTVDALQTILPALKARGYQFVTVSQLLELGQPQAGA